tara:strand:+ start:2745 stop:3434 length:690 start_codon:yes stop_codon:yes gene_type:complete
MTSIIVDTRENALYNEIISRDMEDYEIKIEKKQLEIGDIIISNQFTNIIIERKTHNDIIASVKDGRYHEQKSRLLSLENTQILYLFEKSYVLQEDNMLQGVILNTLLRDNIHILFTKNIEDTATLLLTICVRLCKKPDSYIFKANDYSMNLQMKIKKIDNIDHKTCFILQLGQIPSISNKIANIIALKHENMKDFLNHLNSIENKTDYLETFEKIGKKKAEIILEYLGL